MSFLDEVAGVFDALEAARIDYAVCGGIAVAIHGHPRFTKDIDLLVRREDLDRIRAAVRTQGFEIEAGLIPFGFGTPEAREIFRVSKVIDRELLTLDLLFAEGRLEVIWKERIQLDWGGRRVSAVSRQGLISMKRLAGRPQDHADIDRLEHPTDE